MENYDFFQQESLSTTPFRRIGAGFCGSVWAAAETTNNSSVAVKRADGGPKRSLLNDSNMHQLLLRSLNSCPTEFRSFLIPRWHQYVPYSHRGWKDGAAVLARFPSECLRCSSLVTQRIPPFPQDIRHLLVDKYCPPSLVADIKNDRRNDDCLVRPYLGRRRPGQRMSKFKAFSLRNHALHVDQMEELGLDVGEYARRMAQALAFMHWVAKVDANDMEFVLAPSPEPRQQQEEQRMESPVLGSHYLWVLDFDCCREMDMDEAGIEQTARAFLRNDPYFPRPGRTVEADIELWRHFKGVFLVTSARIIGDDESRMDLPAKLMDTIERLVASK